MSKRRAFVGHSADPSGEILDLGYVRCLDTYCYGGRWLSAWDVSSDEVWQANNRGHLRQRTVDTKQHDPQIPQRMPHYSTSLKRA